MLTAVRLKDFKNHVDTEVRLGRLTCLVGPNGCGKTSVLEAIQFACTTLDRGAVAFFRGPYTFEDFIRKGAKNFTVGIEATGGDENKNSIAIDITLESAPPSNDPPLTPRPPPGELPDFKVKADWETNWDREAFLRALTDGHPPNGSGAFARDGQGDDVTVRRWRPYGLTAGYGEIIPSAFLFSPAIPRLRAPSYSRREIATMSRNGTTLASVIAYLITTEPERFAELQARIRTVVPAVQRLRVRPARIELTEPATVTVKGREIPYSETREVIGHELLFDLKDAPGVPARAVSEGTLLVTALLTATVWNQGADVLLIDDLEKGLHPKAQRELVTALKTLVATDPKLQIAFSTHSPYVVDELTADQVWILVPDEQRGVVARQLSDHPRAAEALQVLTTGEFLSAEGEDWVREAPADA